MKLSIKPCNKTAQADPFIFEDDGKFYIYATATKGVDAYFSDDLFSEWEYYGVNMMCFAEKPEEPYFKSWMPMMEAEC
mgnify:CR=1 FL=1